MAHQLCEVVPGEYSRLTSSYKAKSEKADKLYDEVCGKDWADSSLWNMRDVTKALDAAARCREAIEEEILGRRQHHDRFFADRDDGHEAWIRCRRERAREVEAIAKQLRVCKTMLSTEEQAREVEVRRREEALQRNKNNLAQSQRQKSYASTTRQTPTQYFYPRGDSDVSNYSPPQSHRMGCMVLQPGSATLHCDRDVVRGGLICQQHSEELRTATISLRLEHFQKSIRFERHLDDVTWRIRLPDQYDQDRLDADIATVMKCKELLLSIDALSAQVDRLSPGKPASPSQSSDHARVDDLLRILRRRAAQPRPPPAQEKNSDRTSAYTRPSQDNASDGDSWVSTALAVVGTAVAVWFGFRR
ncbi:hypothetical protein C8Q73DRAFT_794385 [Cubamyces lactineus]|nr:hypothetical protein C8Q73DRAFT_794385 [Cubamyces lactineus]